MRDYLKEFRQFLMRGNLLQLAVAFIMGLYFKDVVDAFTNGIVLALVAAIFGEENFVDITIGVGDSELLVGVFLNAVINFVLVAFVLFAIVRAYEQLLSRVRRGAEADEPEPLTREGELLAEIRDLLRARS